MTRTQSQIAAERANDLRWKRLQTKILLAALKRGGPGGRRTGAGGYTVTFRRYGGGWNGNGFGTDACSYEVRVNGAPLQGTEFDGEIRKGYFRGREVFLAHTITEYKYKVVRKLYEELIESLEGSK